MISTAQTIIAWMATKTYIAGSATAKAIHNDAIVPTINIISMITAIAYIVWIDPVVKRTTRTVKKIMRPVIKYAGKQMIKCYIVTICFITMAVYLNAKDSANDRSYIPKSKRNKGVERMKAHLKARGRKLKAWMYEKMQKWLEIPRRYKRKRKRVSTRAIKINEASKRIRKPPRKMLVLMTTLLVMSAADAKSTERNAVFDTDSRKCGIDNRASYCISDNPADFVGELQDCYRVIKGFGGTRDFKIKKGTLLWRWYDDNGREHKFFIPDSYYIPKGRQRLLSPQHWAQSLQKTDKKSNAKCVTDDEMMTLEWGNGKFTKSVTLDKTSNVATFSLASGYSKYEEFHKQAGFNEVNDENPIMKHELTVQQLNIIEDDELDGDEWAQHKSDNPWKEGEGLDTTPHEASFDLNMTKAPKQKYCIPIVEDDEEKERPIPEGIPAQLLQYHNRFGHISFKRLKMMAKVGIIPKHLKDCEEPVCAACMYSKSTKRPWRNKPRMNYKPAESVDPGEVVSVDQLVSPTPGLIAQITGKLTTKRYKYATVFVDQHSRLGYVHLQKTATAEETIEGKKAFEQYAADRGVSIKAYHADNGIFKAKKWREECIRNKQKLTFAGVNAHHTNGLAEKRIRDLQDLARSQLIHASNKWNKCISANLWPYAIKMANDIINNTPSPRDEARRTSEQIFSKTAAHINAKHYQPFGCPTYVLANELQQNNPYHKWKERSKVGIYLGHSPQHGRNVALVLDRKTGLVSPQFHVKFDPNFDVVDQLKLTSEWQVKAGFVAQREKPATEKAVTWGAKANPANPSNQTMTYPQGILMNQDKRRQNQSQNSQKKRKRTQTDVSKRKKRSETQEGNLGSSQEDERAAAANSSDISIDEIAPSNKTPEMEQATSTPSNTAGGEKKTHPHNSPNLPNLIEAMLTEISENHQDQNENSVEGEIFCYTALCPDGENTIHREDPLYVFKSTVDPDTLYHHEAMREPDKEKFKEAMQKEIDDRINGKNFSIVHKSTVPEGATVLPAVWQLRRKRDIRTRKIKKYKARLNIDGSRMVKGVHYDESYAPVASWNSIRMLLTMTAVHGWHTKQLDYVAAFPQAPVERELYMKIPAGVDVGEGNNKSDYVLKLHKNMYGQKNAGRVWNQYLVDKLINEVGFTQSKVDECVFYHGKVLYVLYTDDSILAGPDPKEIEKIMDKMRKAKLDITIEGDLEDFLGVNINRKKDGTIHLTQPHLIDSILKDLNLDGENVKTRDTPACSSRILRRHVDSKPFDNQFNYCSVIGKLNYLERGSRSDISYIVHQCARFTSAPKKEHGDAIRWLGRYLKGTRDKGTILRPDKGKNLEVYVDADFAGNFHKDESYDRDTARSRHGYIIRYQGCPIIWKSQLQTKITLSSTESEYTGMSYALREAIPMMNLLKEMKEMGFPISDTKAKIKCEVFEDNSGALEMANNHKYRPRTKHLCVKMHHFRDYVSRGEVIVTKIGTKEQLSDYLTKPVNLETLEPLRKGVMGW